MRLTPKQEAFAQAYVETGNASEAYREAYPKARSWKPETVHSKASHLLNNGKVLARINELREELARLSLWTREQSVRALAEIVQTSDKPAEIIAAVKELNAMHGYNAPERLEVSGTPPAPVILKIGDRIVDPKELGW